MITKANCHEALGQMWVGLPMPFGADDTLDLDGLRSNLRFMVGQGIRVIAFPVGLAEMWSVTPDEYRTMVETAREETAGRALLVAGAAYFSAPMCVQLAQIAERAGADLLMVSAPSSPPAAGDQEVYRHFRYIADRTALPLQVYQGDAPRPLTMEIIERLVDIPNVVAYKELPYNPTYFYNLARRFGDRIALIMGRRGEGELRQIFYREAGAVGYWSILAACDPELAWAHWRAWQARDYDTIKAICARTAPIFDLYSDMYDEYFLTPSMNNIVAYKEILNAVGLAGGITRPPLALATPDDQARVRRALTEAGVQPIAAAPR